MEGREKESQGEPEISQLLGHSPDGSGAWPGRSQEAGVSSKSLSHASTGAQALESTSNAFLGAISR